MKVSIVTATRNCVATIDDCLDSVAKQTYSNREHVVIDGASTDGTMTLLRRRESEISCLISEPDEGIYDALNKGIRRSTGEIVGFLHSDDIFAAPDVLREIAAHFENAQVDAVYGDLQYVKRDNLDKVVRNWRSSEFSPRKLRWGWMPPHPTLYVRRSWYLRIGGFDTNLKIAADYLAMLKLFSQPTFKAVYVPRVLVKMRIGGISNRSLSDIFAKSREDLTAMRQTGTGGVAALTIKNLSKLTQFIT